VDIVAAVDLDVQRLRALLSTHAIPAGYGDLDRALADLEPDLVHLATPPFTHVPLIRAGVPLENRVEVLTCGFWLRGGC
jgi:predicted dehydrogenase